MVGLDNAKARELELILFAFILSISANTVATFFWNLADPSKPLTGIQWRIGVIALIVTIVAVIRFVLLLAGKR